MTEKVLMIVLLATIAAEIINIISNIKTIKSNEELEVLIMENSKLMIKYLKSDKNS